MNLENPLLISLLIYIPICLFLYYSNSSLLGKKNSQNEDDYQNESNGKVTIFNRNKNIIFILLPFILYGVSSIFISKRSKHNYCKYLKQKDLKIKDLLEKCKKT